MKKLLTLLLVFLMMFSLAACNLGGGDDPKPSVTNNPSQSEGNNENNSDSSNTDQPSNTNENETQSGLNEERAQWVDNTLTANIPKPTCGTLHMTQYYQEWEQYHADITDFTDVQAASYIQSLKDQGWQGTEQGSGSMVIFNATKGDMQLEVTYTYGTLSLIVAFGEIQR